MIVDEAREIVLKYLPDIDSHLLDTIISIHFELPQMGIDENEVREDNLLMTAVFVVLSQLQYSKEGTYGRSWCKRGELDVFFNLARKFDRLENMMINGSKDEVGEPMIDTVGDEANYGLLWMTLFLRKHPKVFLDWIKNNSN